MGMFLCPFDAMWRAMWRGVVWCGEVRCGAAAYHAVRLDCIDFAESTAKVKR